MPSEIRLRGVEVHNLKKIDLDLPLRKFIVFCGVSGSGKSSLAFDTLHAEGQRRYLASFSAYARQFLERLEKPAAASIDGMPAAIAVRGRHVARSERATVGAATEAYDFLRLLFAQAGHVVCPGCGRQISRDDVELAAAAVDALPAGARLQVGYEIALDADGDRAALAASLREDGLPRAIVGGRTVDLSVEPLPPGAGPVLVTVDRLTAGSGNVKRLRDSLETAWRRGEDRCLVLTDAPAATWGPECSVDGRPWRRRAFGARLACEPCGREFIAPEPRLFSFNSPLGACPACQGTGRAPRATVKGRGQRRAKTEPAPSTVESPETPKASAADSAVDGDACPACGGARLRPEALAVRVAGLNVAEWAAGTAGDSARRIESLPLTEHERAASRHALDQLASRLAYLMCVGLGYLALDRPLRTLSSGEARRVSLTSALGSSLVNMLYVFDEPSAGLHPRDADTLLAAIVDLGRRGNTLVVVEHDEAFIRAADWAVEIGPAAGERGGQVVYSGPPAGLLACEKSPTGDYLAGRRVVRREGARRPAQRGRIRLVGARGNNLQNLTVEFPLGVLCVVSGVSGSGKSSLVSETLYPALRRRLHKESIASLPYDDVFGDGQIEDVVLVDQSPVGRSPRSNPVTYIKAFDDIRTLFAETVLARTRNYGAGHFSFNLGDGRCPTCEGDGQLAIDMQFLADVYMRCPQCQGRRYRPEILDVTYRGLNIAEVLEMTVREAFAFFRGQSKLQGRLKALMDVGLDYPRLGQPAHTLSGGEAQRMKLAMHLASARRGRTLFLLDEPTAGLHFADVGRLLDCFDSLIGLGHSLIVVSHNGQTMLAADYLIDLGPGAAAAGGCVVAAGPPEEVATHADSATGAWLQDRVARGA